jgi:type II secretion system protein N
MIRNALVALASAGWFGFVFLVTWWLTFPSAAVIARLQYEADARSEGKSALEIADVSLWWFGLRADGVKLYSRDPRRPDQPATLTAMASEVAASVGPFGLAIGHPYVSGHVVTGESTIDFGFAVQVDAEKNKGWSTTDLYLSGPGIQAADLAGFLPIPAVLSGAVDLAADISGDGMRAANGSASLRGKDLTASDFGLEGLSMLGLPEALDIDELDLELSVKDGKATVSKGSIVSPLGVVTVEGDLSLKDDLFRTAVRLTAVVELQGEAEKFSAIFADARWADGKLHFTCTGYLSAPSCRSDREGRRDRAISRGTPPLPPGAPLELPDAGGAPLGPMDDADRERRKDEVRERLRKRREERSAARGGTPGGPDDGPAGDEPTPPDEGGYEPTPSEDPVDEGAGFDEEP